MEKSYVGTVRCFLCLQPSLVLLDRRLRKSLPSDCGVINTEPCPECEMLMGRGIIVMTATTESLNQIEEEQREFYNDPENRDFKGNLKRNFIPNPYRTGGWFVITEEACRRWFAADKEGMEAALRRRWTFMEHELAEKMGLFEFANDEANKEKEIPCGCQEGCGCCGSHD